MIQNAIFAVPSSTKMDNPCTLNVNVLKDKEAERKELQRRLAKLKHKRLGVPMKEIRESNRVALMET